ncbi:amidohydrolase family protein [Nocardia callitridis]|uniref:6-methylsalicylate decarboxylase n=1 Tax=Nocardia callitridis TaxID=648753 RepID=A0ABP9KV50_9NOCA
MTDGLIDVHAHFTTDDYIEAAKTAGKREPDGMPEAYWPRWDAHTHLDLMDQAGIARSVLSLSSPGVHLGDDAEAKALARTINEFGAGVRREHPDRFGHFASLPLPDVDAALAEIAYALDELGADGVALMTNVSGIYLADKRIQPVLEELDRRAAVVFLHPTSCVGHEEAALGYPRPMIEFIFETARTIVDFILSGAAQRYRHLRLIVPHAGGVLPLLADRLELFRTLDPNNGGPPVRESLRGFYYDLAGTAFDPQLTALATIAETDQLLYGSDYCWTPPAAVLRALTDLDKVEHPSGRRWRASTTRNARYLLGLAE